MKRIKYIYFFRGDLDSHVDIYKSWVDVSKDSIDISLFTILDNKTFIKQEEKVKYYKKQGVVILKTPRFCKKIFTILYFTYLCIFFDKVVVHLRKQSPKPFDMLKKIFKKKLKYIIDIEGDFESEIDFLSNPKHKYKPKFYNNIISSMKTNTINLKEKLFKADGVFLATEIHKSIYMNRYGQELNNKLFIIPTGFDSSKFFIDENKREEYRKKYKLEDKLVMIYSGNIFYSWQNISRTIKLFKLLKKELYQNLYLIILTRKQDFYIAEEFIKKNNLEQEDFLLENVAFDKVNYFLNASDIGILLRDNHILNNIATTAKIGEYLSSGLHVITSKYIGLYSKEMEKASIGILLDDIYDNNEILSKIKNYNFNNSREEISKWASDSFSVQAYKDKYISALQSL